MCVRAIIALLLLTTATLVIAEETNSKKAAEEWPLPRAFESIFNNDLKHYLKNADVRQFSSDLDPFLALYTEHNDSAKKGTIIFIADWQQAAINPQGFQSLPDAMSDLGWSSYRFTLANPLATDTSVDDAPDNPVAPMLKGYKQSDLDAYRAKLSSRFKLVYDEAATDAKNIVVVVQGHNSAFLTNYLATDSYERVAALVVLNGYFNQPELNKLLAENIASLRTPILDISYQDLTPWQTQEQKLRKRLVKRNNKPLYRQRTLFGAPGDDLQNSRLSKEVYGFLSSVPLKPAS